MSADVPLEEHDAGVSPGRLPPAPEDWVATPYWDAFVVAVLGLMALVGALAGEGAAARWTASGALAALAAFYLAYGRRVLRRGPFQGWRAAPALAGYAALFVPAATAVPSVATALVALAPLAFMTIPGLPAATAVGAMLYGPALLRTALDPSSAGGLAVELPVLTVVLLFSLWFGGWIGRIIRQSAERAKLIEELERSREQAAALSAQAGALAERERIARDIHDTLAQGFTSVVALAQAVESEMDRDPEAARRHLELIKETGRENLAEARALVAGGAAGGTALELEEALRRTAGRSGQEAGADTAFTVRGDAPGRLPPEVQVDLLRGAQEALANARRHAGASRIGVLLEYLPGACRVTVRDDGRGFDPGAARCGFGLVGMRRRAEAAGGSLALETAPGGGTEVRLEIPYPGGAAGTRGTEEGS
ncbi:sensor histidine kinase [Nocardiopsis sp. RSe5-2]|uniref:Sensor histidine kinase n=1 Tax=Nocardiopsis endophytica TaxID=3018445 RepID=A0ABT4U0H4_9ACTN|nr:sensor histidine kinase [Nocardiopsis endophytica]MDA2810438.1 sensor histidine kinase [Nocardiopsis endophytica]